MVGSLYTCHGIYILNKLNILCTVEGGMKGELINVISK